MSRSDEMRSAPSPRVQARWPRLVVRPTALVFALLLGCASVAAYAVHVVAAALGAVPLSGIPAGWFVVLFAASFLGLELLHELGHGISYLALGLPWERLTIAAHLSVSTTAPHTFRAQLLISAAGPAVQLIAAAVVFAAAANPWSLAGLIGLAGLAVGAVNALVPQRGSDAGKIYKSAWAILRGRGSHLAFGG